MQPFQLEMGWKFYNRISGCKVVANFKKKSKIILFATAPLFYCKADAKKFFLKITKYYFSTTIPIKKIEIIDIMKHKFDKENYT